MEEPMASSDAVVFKLTTLPTGGGAAGTSEGEVSVRSPTLLRDSSAPQALWELLGKRVQRAIAQALGQSPMSVSDLTRILEEPSDVGATAALLARAAMAASVVAVDPLAEAKARAIQAEAELLEAAGGTLTADDVAQLLGITRQAVERRRDRGTVLALRASGGMFVYPVCQFQDGQLLAGIDRFLAAFPEGTSPWSILNVLVGPSDALDGRTPLEALRAGDIDQATEVAEAAFDEAA
jgi:hypothetical protein